VKDAMFEAMYGAWQAEPQIDPAFRYFTETGEQMDVRKMNTPHIINAIAHVWRITALQARGIDPKREVHPQNDSPHVVIERLLTELKNRDFGGGRG
jgi:hypothetical protein